MTLKMGLFGQQAFLSRLSSLFAKPPEIEESKQRAKACAWPSKTYFTGNLALK